MKTRVAFFLAASGLMVLVAWLVHRNKAPQFTPQGVLTPVAQGGGSKPTPTDGVPEKYRDTVRKGLEYLVKNQHKDGHWEGDGGKHPVAMTALVGMALLMEGGNLQKGKYSANLRKAVDWLMDNSKPGREGLIYSDHPSETDRYMHGHGLATQFLAWACRNETDKVRRKKLDAVLTRAAKYIVKAQSTRGGWYKTSRVEGHDFDTVSATAIQIQALYMIGNLGLPVRSEAVASDAQAYLKTELAKYAKGVKPGPNRNRRAETAAALACRCCPDAYLDQDGLCTEWSKYCRTEIPVGRGSDALTHYYYAQAVFNDLLNETRSGKAYWNEYRTAMFDYLQSSQNKDGSWPAALDSKGGISVGPV